MQGTNPKSKLPLNLFDTKGLYELSESHYDVFHRYYTGKTSSYKEAINLRNKTRSKGFNDAFVVAFKNDSPIPLDKALKELGL